MTIAIGCDHAGVELKRELLSLLDDLRIKYVDYGTETPESVDYPDFGEKVSAAVSSGKMKRGILICGTE
jgi:ribose 5-phosphate isomerase B